MKPYSSVEDLLRPALRVAMPWLKGVLYLLSSENQPVNFYDGEETHEQG